MTGLDFGQVTAETAALLLPLILVEVAAKEATDKQYSRYGFWQREDGRESVWPGHYCRDVALLHLCATIRETFGEDLEEPRLGL